MTRAAVLFGFALALAACGRDEKPAAANQPGSATEVTVDSAKRTGDSAARTADEKTKVTVESAVPGEKPTDQ